MDEGPRGGIESSVGQFKPEQVQALLNLINNSDEKIVDRMTGPTLGEPDWSR
ncbi:unnamed protein product [Cuscuta epithymum]|uniref:Uncharacterized protein n=1 Tax=Cuscuta epithymum TaxID=186058 RepID=A0AAV0EGG1_9ASTE|nr:unnamed protein product [Cuscuta epithymum]